MKGQSDKTRPCDLRAFFFRAEKIKCLLHVHANLVVVGLSSLACTHALVGSGCFVPQPPFQVR